MIVMKFGGTSVQDAQAIDRVAAIVRECLPEHPAKISALANTLTLTSNPAPEARNRLAHPEASNAKPEGWVRHKKRSSPVGATQREHVPCSPASFPLPKPHPPATQVSGHEFTRAAQPQNNLGFSPCEKDSQGLKANSSIPFTARLKSCPDTCLAIEEKTVVLNSTSPMAVLRASVPPWWRLFR